MGPFALGGWSAHLVEVLIGLAFGFVLESTGFGDARRLAAQFYFRELRVVQAMFTAIVTAMLLLYLSSGLRWLDLDQLWVNPTYVPSVALGGLIFGVGFAIGGYCPGTSLASLATGKIDGFFFVLGSLLGMFAFGETADYFRAFYYAGHFGPLQLTDLFGVSTATAVGLVALLALAFFGGLKFVARRLGHERPVHWPKAMAGTALLLGGVGAVAALGQPSLDAKWERLGAKYQPQLARREVFIVPAELLALQGDRDLKLVTLDLRPESDWNRFHLANAERVSIAALPSQRRRLISLPDPSVVILISNDETSATAAWRHLALLGVPNVYVLAGGLNRWIATYGAGSTGVEPITTAVAGDDRLHWRFAAALGDRHPAAALDPEHAPKLPYTPTVKLRPKGKKSGGCG
ncbi:MAG: YeeE/YedE family protein [Proteobacteria bacterium]|nr:YeeE/YedE family protein [Pseudomonadota bacterium]